MATVPSHHLATSPRSPPDPFTDPATAQRRPPPLPPKTTARSSHMPPPRSKSAQAPRDANPDLAQAVRDTVVVRPSPETKSRSRVGRSHTTQSVLLFAISSASFLMILNIDVLQVAVCRNPSNTNTNALSFPGFSSGKVKDLFQRSLQEGIATRGCDRPSRLH